MDTVICPRCGSENRADAMNCRECRINLKFAFENPAEIMREWEAPAGISISGGRMSNFNPGVWITVNTFGMMVAVPVSWLILLLVMVSLGMTYSEIGHYNWFLIEGLVIGAVLGCVQWLQLRSLLANAQRWILYSSIGLAIGIITSLRANFLILRWDTVDVNASLIAGVIIGSTLGIIQWLCLRKQLKYAFLWVLGNIFGLGFGMAWGWPPFIKHPFDSEVVGMILLALLTFMVMIIYGSITGILLAWLLNHPLQDYKLSPDSAGSRGGGTA